MDNSKYRLTCMHVFKKESSLHCLNDFDEYVDFFKFTQKCKPFRDMISLMVHLFFKSEFEKQYLDFSRRYQSIRLCWHVRKIMQGKTRPLYTRVG